MNKNRNTNRKPKTGWTCQIMKNFLLFFVISLALVAATGLSSCSKKQVPVEDPVEAQKPSEDDMEPPPPPPVESDKEEPILESELEPVQPSPREMDFEPSVQLQDVYFAYDKSDLTEETRQILRQNVEWIHNSSDVRIQIEGHTDERGTEEYNLALGERRARTVKNYLVSLGADPVRFYTISYGEELPVNPEHNEAAWSQNRRAHFLVTQ